MRANNKKYNFLPRWLHFILEPFTNSHVSIQTFFCSYKRKREADVRERARENECGGFIFLTCPKSLAFTFVYRSVCLQISLFCIIHLSRVYICRYVEKLSWNCLIPWKDPPAHPDNDRGNLSSVQDQEVQVEPKQGLPEHHGQSYPPEKKQGFNGAFSVIKTSS